MNEQTEIEKCKKCAAELIGMLDRQVKSTVWGPFDDLFKDVAREHVKAGATVISTKKEIKECLAVACFTAACVGAKADGVYRHFSKVDRLFISKFLMLYPGYKEVSNSINMFVSTSMDIASNSAQKDLDVLDDICELWFWKMLLGSTASDSELRKPIYRKAIDDSCRVFHSNFKNCLIRYFGEPDPVPHPSRTGCIIPIVVILGAIGSAIAAL